MNLEEFVKKYNGKKVDFDGAFGAQCVDLFRQYNKDVFGLPHTGAVEGAVDLFIDYKVLPSEQLYYIAFVPKRINQIKAGDVVIFNSTNTNIYGHVAIVLGILGESLIVFEQNGLLQDGAKIVLRSIDNICGVLRRK